MTEVVAFVDEGLGHSSYVVDLGDGRVLVVDPPRIPDRHVDEALSRGLAVAFTADTHSHADYVSGSPELGAQGALFLAPTDANLEVAHHGLAAGDEIELRAGLVLRAIATPGHTPEHLAYLLCEDGRPIALFSGGSLMVGTVGRTDLLGPDSREELARQLYRALREDILTLPDNLPVYPTHGAGSFCSAPGASERTTTIGRERATNPMLAAPDEDAFVETLLAGFGSFPAYFSRLPEMNRRRPRLYGTVPALDRVGITEFQQLAADGATVVDARPIEAFGRAHIPDALSIALRPVFASWLGWLVEPDRPLVFVLDVDQDRAELVRQCLTVGYEQLVGELDGGMNSWRAANLPEEHIEIVTADGVRPSVVDVRQRSEYAAGRIPGAFHVELGSLLDGVDRLPTGHLTVMCAHGERAMTAASMLAVRGRADVSVLAGGPEDWANATGHALE